MNREVIFVVGAYGVGKTTLCNKLSRKVKIPSYSASDLISPKVREVYGAQKSVTNKEKNQQALIQAVKELPNNEHKILLSGHFCIFNRDREIEQLPEFVFTSLGIRKIILLITDSSIIMERLYVRDNVTYTKKSIDNLINQEKIFANKFATRLECPLIMHQMRFDNSDVDILAKFLLTE